MLPSQETLRELDEAVRRIIDLELQVKLLTARLEDLRAEVRTAGTRQALLNGLGKRR